MRYTPRFPKDPWEIMKIHEISLIFYENSSKSMKNHGFSGFLKDPLAIEVCISSTPPSCVHAYREVLSRLRACVQGAGAWPGVHGAPEAVVLGVVRDRADRKGWGGKTLR